MIVAIDNDDSKYNKQQWKKEEKIQSFITKMI